MFLVKVHHPDGQVDPVFIPGDSCVVGRGADCAVRLGGLRVSREHARIYAAPGGLIVEDLGGLIGTRVNGKRITFHGPIELTDEIIIAGYLLTAELGDRRRRAGSVPNGMERRQAPQARVAVHLVDSGEEGSADAATPQAPNPDIVWRRKVHERLLETIDLRRKDVSRMGDEQLRHETDQLVTEILDSFPDLPPDIDRDKIRRDVLNEAVGLGPLEELLANDDISEIMVNRFDEIFVERAGRLRRHELTFSSDRAVMGVIERIVAPLGRRIDESSPMVDARLKDGSRVNAIIPPVSLKGPTLTIRKFSKRRLDGSDLVKFGALSEDMLEFLRLCVETRKNIIVSGGTASGKTTLLNVLSNFIPAGERIITIEDAAELRLNHSHLVSLESRPSNVEGKGQVAIRDLVRNSLRMRPDRIVIGECRSGEALDMLQAMNTGHEGSLTTLHANTPRDALSRLETMVMMAGVELPIAAIRDQMASAVDIILQQTRFSCGSRKVTHITEVTGIEGSKIQIQDLFRFEHNGVDKEGRVQGQFSGCDTVPTFYEELEARGYARDLSLFNSGGRA